jgi:hypothetical protein
MAFSLESVLVMSASIKAIFQYPSSAIGAFKCYLNLQGALFEGHQNPFIEEASTSVNSHPPNPMKVELASPSQQVV